VHVFGSYNDDSRGGIVVLRVSTARNIIPTHTVAKSGRMTFDVQ